MKSKHKTIIPITVVFPDGVTEIHLVPEDNPEMIEFWKQVAEQQKQ